MRARSRRVGRLLGRLSPRRRASCDWQAWITLPRRLAARLDAIDRVARSITVAYPRHAGTRPAARRAPCRLIAAAALDDVTLRRLQALERGYGRRFVLVAYRCAEA